MLRTRDEDATIEARRDMAAALRWAAKLGLSEGICNHFSLVVPGRGDRFLGKPGYLRRGMQSRQSPTNKAL